MFLTGVMGPDEGAHRPIAEPCCCGSGLSTKGPHSARQEGGCGGCLSTLHRQANSSHPQAPACRNVKTFTAPDVGSPVEPIFAPAPVLKVIESGERVAATAHRVWEGFLTLASV